MAPLIGFSRPGGKGAATMGNLHEVRRRGAPSRWGVFAVLLLASVLVPATVGAHDGDHDDDDGDSRPAVRPPEGDRVRPQRPDRELRRILDEIDKRNIENTIRMLVSFGTRSTLSSQTDPARGI